MEILLESLQKLTPAQKQILNCLQPLQILNQNLLTLFQTLYLMILCPMILCLMILHLMILRLMILHM